MQLKRVKLTVLGSMAGAALVSLSAAALEPAAVNHHPDSVMVLDATRAGTRIVAVGEHGNVLLSDDDGKTQRQSRKVAADLTLTAVSFSDARNGWAVGHGGVILHTADGGETWALQRQDAAVDQPLLTVYFRDAQHGWAGGLWSLLLSTQDGGATWQKVELPAQDGGKRTDLNLLKIFASQSGQLYIAAERGTVLHSADNGASWHYLNTGSKASLWSGTAVGAKTLLVAGLGGRMLRSTDDGASWALVNAGANGSITQLKADGAQVWASSLDGRLLHSRDEGQTWQADGAAAEPLTALAARADGSQLRYTRRGLVK
jgi:photosystem II stability/assembly factor-like uncharacterized protein